MFAYVGITKRYAPLDRSAELVKVSLEDERIVARVTLPPPLFDLSHTDLKLRGGRQRGARGVTLFRDEVFVAAHDSIYRYDRKLTRLIGRVSCRRFNDLHEFLVNDKEIVVTCATANAVVWATHDGGINRVWSPLEDLSIRDSFPDIPNGRTEDAEDWRMVYFESDPTHLNSISINPSGGHLVGLHRQAVLWNVEAGKIHHDARPIGASLTHNHVFLNGCNYINDTGSGQLYRISGKECFSLDLSMFGISENRPANECSATAMKHGWLRGLAPVDQRRVIVGQCPASLVVVDFENRAVESVIHLSDDWRWSVHGIHIESKS